MQGEATIRAARDFAGLRQYALELLGRGKRAEVPEGYSLWLGHLDWLEGILEVDPAAAGSLSFEEIEGLRVWREAQRHAQASFPLCPHCQRPSSGQLACSHCGKALPAPEAPATVKA